MADLATATDVEVAWRPLADPQERARVDYWLRRASALVRHHVPAVDARIAVGLIPEVLVRGIVVDAVIRVLENPRGLVSRAQQIGNYSETERYADAAAQGLYLTQADLSLLQNATARPLTQRGAFTVRPGAAQSVRHTDGAAWAG